MATNRGPWELAHAAKKKKRARKRQIEVTGGSVDLCCSSGRIDGASKEGMDTFTERTSNMSKSDGARAGEAVDIDGPEIDQIFTECEEDDEPVIGREDPFSFALSNAIQSRRCCEMF